VRAYVGITGLLFALIFAAHVGRVWADGTGLLRDPFFVLISGAALAVSIWAVVLLSNRRR
jgi:hypothetical protein